MHRAYVTDIGPKESPGGHAFPFYPAYTQNIMRGAFVIQLGPETNPLEGRFEGCVEEVDTSTGLRFRSSEELLKFLGERFELVKASADEARLACCSEGLSLRKKSPGKKRSSR